MPPPPSPRPPRSPVRVAVDMSHLRPGGENGGVKPFLFETLLWLGRQQVAPLRFSYLTCASTHAEVRDGLARVQDEVICVRPDEGATPESDSQAPRERLCVPPPLDLIELLGADMLYCPFGPVDFAVPGIGTISMVVDVLHRDFPWTLPPAHNAARETVFQEIVAKADRLQCISWHVVGRMQAHYDVPAARCFTTHIAIHERFAAMPLAPERMPDGDADPEEKPAPFFFYPANAWKHKNHESLLLAYGIYHAGERAAGRVPWPLVLTGHEEARWQELRALAATLDLLRDDAVQFRGYVPPGEYGRIWDTAGALVFPSLHEGFGIPLVEAMQHDLPVLTGSDGSLREVGADACLYADARRPLALAEAMTRLAGDAALRADLIARGRRRRADFSLARESGHLLDAILHLAHHGPDGRAGTKGVFPDGWTEGLALFALPSATGGDAAPVRLTLCFHPLPAPRRVRLRVGRSVALGTFDLPAFRTDNEIVLATRPGGGSLRMEVLDAANLDPDDARLHGVHLQSIVVRLGDGREHILFAA